MMRRRGDGPANRGRFPAAGIGPHNIRGMIPWETIRGASSPPGGGGDGTVGETPPPRPGERGPGSPGPATSSDDDDPAK